MNYSVISYAFRAASVNYAAVHIYC